MEMSELKTNYSTITTLLDYYGKVILITKMRAKNYTLSNIHLMVKADLTELKSVFDSIHSDTDHTSVVLALTGWFIYHFVALESLF